MEKKQCPFCGEEIMMSAKKYKHCGEWLPEYGVSSGEGDVLLTIPKSYKQFAYWWGYGTIIGILFTIERLLIDMDMNRITWAIFAVDMLVCWSFFLMHGYIKNYVARNNRFEVLGWVIWLYVY